VRGTGVNALRSFRSCIDEAKEETKSGELGGSSGGLIYMSYLVIYLMSQGMRSKPW